MSILNITLKNEQETQTTAHDLALTAQTGYLLTLSGELGAGKTSFAREFIRQYLNLPELEVPSPTYLIALDYKNASHIQATHMDLYRISDPDELDELGLDEALSDGIAIIEWPQRAGDRLTAPTLHLEFKIVDVTTRELQITGNKNAVAKCERSLEIRNFLRTNWNDNITRIPFAADASARNYELITHKSEHRLLMDAPRAPDGPPLKDGLPYSRIAHLAEEVLPFVAVANLLKSNGFCAPQIFAYNLDDGLVLLEHLGDGNITDTNNDPISERYIHSAQLLAQMHSLKWANSGYCIEGKKYQLPEFDEPAMMVEADLLASWYLPDVNVQTSMKNDIAEYHSIWKNYCAVAQSFEKSIVLRDYHSPNIIWRDKKPLKDSIGLIDFQDALIGPAAYDLVSLAQDARVKISKELERSIVDQYISARVKNNAEFDIPQFHFEYALMGAQRASKILGIFVRLDKRDGKPQYRKLLPQISEYLKRNLQHPKLSAYKNWCNRVIEL